jgi:hypothetical protein
MDTMTYTQQAYEMLGVVVSKGFKDAYIEVIGGGDLGVTIPNLVGGTCHALITVDFGLALWDNNEDIIWASDFDYFFDFDVATETSSIPLWQHTAKAVDDLKRYLGAIK